MCLQTIYGLKSGVLLSTLLHMPYPDRGLALYPECVYTPIYPFLAHFSALQDMCICMLSVLGPSLKYGPFPPRGDKNPDTEAP